jgi:lipopolysaccharide export system protein LptA
MASHRHHPLRNLLPWLLLGLLAGCPALLGQTVPPDKSHSKTNNPAKPQQPFTSHFHVQRSFYPPPDEGKVKMEVFGREATNVPAGALITGAIIKTYSILGGPPQLTAETPDCIADSSTFQVSSTNILQARSGDGDFYVEGVGFLWLNGISQLTLSNRVHTIIHQPVSTNAAARTDSPPSQTDVYSDDAVFNTKSGLIIYHDHIRVIDPRLHLTSVILTVQLSQNGGSNQLDHITAETNVIMDFIDESGRKTHATSEKAVYKRITEPVTNDLLTLSVNPRLETTNGWATADVFVMNRTTGKIQGVGNCHFHTLAAAEPADGATNKTTPQITEIFSDEFNYDTNTDVAVFRDNVRLDNPQLKLVCEKLTAKLPAGADRTNDLQYAVAETNVAIDYFDEHGEKTHATAEKAVYSTTIANGVTNKVLDLTGNPVLERTNGWIMADFITMDRLNGTLRAEVNHHTIFKKQPGHVSSSTPPAAADTEIFSDHFDYSTNTGLAFYSGNARVLDPQMHLQCAQLTVKLPEGASAANTVIRPDRIVAETNVIVDYFTEKGEKTHATGEKMVFTHTVTNGITNEVLELTGHPIVDMTNLKGEKTHATGDKVVYNSVTGGGNLSELVNLIGHPRVETTNSVTTSGNVMIYDRVTGNARGLGPTNRLIYTLGPPKPAATNKPPALSSVPAH